MERNCDICKQNGKNTKAIVDRATTFRQWAYLCEVHNNMYGVGKETVLAEVGDY